MRAIIQRVMESKVDVKGRTVGGIGPGLLIFLGVGREDSEKDADYLASKILNLRIFSDAKGHMNLSLLDTAGEILVVSQFTLWGDCRKGRRPSFSGAAEPERAEKLYNYFISILKESRVRVSAGIFQAMMEVHILNDGPVTIMLDSEKTF